VKGLGQCRSILETGWLDQEPVVEKGRRVKSRLVAAQTVFPPHAVVQGPEFAPLIRSRLESITHKVELVEIGSAKAVQWEKD